jgi:hypothetical protein
LWRREVGENQVERLGAHLNDSLRRRAVLRLFNVKAFGFERAAEELTHRRFVLVSTYTVARELGHESDRVEQHLGGFGDVRNEDAPRSRM